MRTVATAGHVDHGKSSLVLALTGTDPDRFPEEKSRGLTIDLGFAFTTLASGAEIGFVDVPGHVRFLKNMLAGVGAVDVAVLVVAATEGWMPQSEEHLRILELLGVRHGLVVLTKADLVDEETLELATLEVVDALTGTPFADAPIVVCDSRSGRGIDDVRVALDAVLAAAPPPVDRARPRLWVDRVFTAKGAGTIVTGTLSGGELAVDDDVVVAPGRRTARVRGVETHHQRLTRGEPGSRVALNLAGIDHHDVRRGDAVVRAGQWAETATFDVALTLFAPPERRRFRVQVHAGSGEHDAWCRLLDDAGRFGRLRLDAPIPVAPGDRLVLRDAGRQETIGGAEVFDVAPLGRASDAPARLVLPLGPRLLATRPWMRQRALGRLTGLGADEIDELTTTLVASGDALIIGEWLVSAAEVTRLRAGAETQVLEHHRADPVGGGVELPVLADALGVTSAQLRATLAGVDALTVERGLVVHASMEQRAADTDEARRFLDALAASPFAPPEASALGVDSSLVRALVREGEVLEIDGIVFRTSAVDDARSRVVAHLAEHGTVTVADARDVLGSTRKYVLALLGRFDAEGVTRRRGDDRILGPRRVPPEPEN